MHIKYHEWTHDSSVGIVNRLRAGRPRIRGLVPAGARYLISDSAARHVTTHTLLRVQCVSRVVMAINRTVSEGDLTLHPVLRLNMSTAVPLLPGIFSWDAE